MSRKSVGKLLFASVLIGGTALSATAQSFKVQCPTSTSTHPTAANNNSEPAFTSTPGVNGAIKCQQIAGGDGYATMADGTQTYMFSFGPLSGIADIAAGLPGTEYPKVFNQVYDPSGQYSAYASSGVTLYEASAPLAPGDPATSNGASDTPYSTGAVGTFTYNGAIGQVPDVYSENIDPTTPATPLALVNGHIDPRPLMDVAVMNGNIPAPLMAIDEDDEFFLTLTNVGMIMRPDLFEQHTVHFHGYPNASAFYDGVPDASVAINIGGSFTYYYLAPDAGTYFWHCHITPPEHLQMGMVGQIYVRPRQNRVASGTDLYTSLGWQQADLRTACNSKTDILCSNPIPAVDTAVKQGTDKLGNPQKYAYNDGDGSTRYDVEYPLQIHGFDPNFHFVGMTFNPEGFADMKDKYFLLNGRSYPDTVQPGPMATPSADSVMHYSQPLPSIINIPVGGRALLRISDLDVSEYQTLASLGIPMHVVGYNAKLLRDQAGNNMDYLTNSITLAGGESLDVILDASVNKSDGTAYKSGDVYYLYTPNLDHLANDAENFGGLMTEIHIN